MIIMNNMRTLTALLNLYPSDEEAGKIFRANYMKMDDVILDMADRIVNIYPNDSDLGAYLRHHNYVLLRKFM